MNKAANVLIWLAVIAAFAAGAHQAYMTGRQDDAENPYEYKLEDLKAVDPALIGYKELDPMQASAVLAIAMGADDTLFLGTKAEIVRYTPGANVQPEVKVAEPVTCLTVGPDCLYGASKRTISCYSLELKKLSTWPALPEQAHITSLAVTEERVYAADAGRRLALAFDRQGKLLYTFGQKNEKKGSPGLVIPSPYFDLFLDKQDRIWLINPGRHTFERYSDTGDRIEHWQASSTTIEGFCGCCNPSHVAILPDGNVVTAEKGLVRIKVYDLSGKMLSVVAPPSAFDDGTVGMDLATDSKGRIFALDKSRGEIRIFEKK